MVSLDLYLAYLRTAFHTCYYCAVITDHLEELQRKCIKHERKPLVTSAESKLLETENPEKKGNEIEKDGAEQEKESKERDGREKKDEKRNGNSSELSDFSSVLISNYCRRSVAGMARFKDRFTHQPRRC